MIIRLAPLVALSLLSNSCSERAESLEPAPRFIDVSTTEAAAMLKADPELSVLDVRTSGEFSNGHLGNAKNIDFSGSDFEKELDELDREKPYLVHCQSGGRSGRALDVFRKLGFQKIYHLHEGFGTWRDSGLPVTE